MIKIAHLYYDLLNLYGEQGNILALKNAFKNQNVEVSVDLYSVGDEVDFKNYDIGQCSRVNWMTRVTKNIIQVNTLTIGE